MCSYDEKLKDYRGKLKPLGRIAGQMASMIFALLKIDQETLAKVSPDHDPLAPMLYETASPSSPSNRVLSFPQTRNTTEKDYSTA
jgi:hypothetical protein